MQELFGVFFHVLQRLLIVLHWHIYDEASTKKIMLKIRPPMTWLWLLEVHVYRFLN